ncbi:MFS transporter [SAR202 cluster bacterium AC-647-N09_OGT_505m]|nr:MFS transporter [SAR202 cluster bacterium AC-647-N09_OGT_505m]
MQKQESKIFYGWWIVLASFVALTFTSMVVGYGFSVFYKRLIDYFGWTRTALAGAISLSRLEAGFLGGIEGFLVDRFGPRTIILLGVVLTSLGLILLSTINSLIEFYVVFILMVTVGRSLSSMIPIDTTVANWFIRRRGTAFGLLRAAVAVGAAGVILISWFIGEFGWRAGFVAGGIGTLVIGIPTALVMRHRPEHYGMLPDGDTPVTKRESETEIAGGYENLVEPDAADPKAQDEADIGMTVMEALQSQPFWTLSFGFAIRLMVTGAATLHAIPLVEDLGYSKATAAAVLGSMGMVSIIGRLGGGLLNDILGTKPVAVGSVCSLAISCLIIAYAQNLWHVVLFVAIYAPSYGCSAATMPAIKGDYFGRRSYGSILGLSGMVQMGGSMLGPVYAAYVYDVTGSYRFAFLSFAALLMISAMLFWSLKRPRYS